MARRKDLTTSDNRMRDSDTVYKTLSQVSKEAEFPMEVGLLKFVVSRPSTQSSERKTRICRECSLPRLDQNSDPISVLTDNSRV